MVKQQCKLHTKCKTTALGIVYFLPQVPGPSQHVIFMRWNVEKALLVMIGMYCLMFPNMLLYIRPVIGQ